VLHMQMDPIKSNFWTELNCHSRRRRSTGQPATQTPWG
jgi:hypothetical protein